MTYARLCCISLFFGLVFGSEQAPAQVSIYDVSFEMPVGWQALPSLSGQTLRFGPAAADPTDSSGLPMALQHSRIAISHRPGQKQSVADFEAELLSLHPQATISPLADTPAGWSGLRILIQTPFGWRELRWWHHLHADGTIVCCLSAGKNHSALWQPPGITRPK